MDNETRQFGSQDRPRPKQVFPEQQYEQQPAQPQYQQPQYQAPQYEEPYYAPYTPPAQEPEERDNVPAIVFGVLFAIAAVAAIVLYFLWRGAAAEANKPR
ncbi:hypothetical protein JKI95_05355 [Corynebacterium aquatimens]|uniref:hypothetical protein n=1 Tax=Corynebacterium aquatimens TaxID=1190508 RepID=UPI002540936D|nr:hypothetical protein [Corynebacterium aquatimens]QYH20320.1 hypothetical protein JKI95_05355 [Corynebacterium aquatimens]